jgi:hypothetical protein
MLSGSESNNTKLFLSEVVEVGCLMVLRFTAYLFFNRNTDDTEKTDLC